LLDSFKEGIDGAAHVGGFITGIVLEASSHHSKQKKEKHWFLPLL
jgi:membrane associated rhomboid family serine protease